MSTTYKCSGTTKKGLQCRNHVPGPNLYCYHHRSNKPSSASNPIASSGYIYIYTYLELYQNATVNKKERAPIDWIRIDYSVINNKSSSGFLSNFIFKPENLQRPWKHKNDYILIKIGMTTRSNVSIRIKEWESKCKHQLVLLTPALISTTNFNKMGTRSTSAFSRIVSKLKQLSISETKIPERYPQIRASTFRNGGFACSNPGHVEKLIHKWLWDEFGKGRILCAACGGKSHTEWALVRTGDLSRVMSQIDRICRVTITEPLPDHPSH